MRRHQEQLISLFRVGLLLLTVGRHQVVAVGRIKAPELREQLSTSGSRLLDCRSDYDREVDGFIANSELVDVNKILAGGGDKNEDILPG